MTISSFIHRILRKSRSGTAAIETAMLLLPFIMVLVGVFEAGSYIGQASILQNAVKTAARLISTGQIHSSDKTLFMSSIAQNTYGLIDTTKLSVSVNAYPSFGAVPSTLLPLFDNNGNPINQTFQTGTGNQVVVVRVGYWYSFVVPALFTASSSGTSTVSSNLVFRNEPF